MFRLSPALLVISTTVFSLISSSLALTVPTEEIANFVRSQSTNEFDALFQGNQAFRQEDPALLKDLALNGQHPPFLFIGCSDSRVSEGTVFKSKPGTFFAERNIANQFSSTDGNIRSEIAYGLEELHVKHIVVMGHYGCGGVAASVASPPPQPWDPAIETIQNWISPIREVYKNSQRQEVVDLRAGNAGKATVPAPTLHDVGFRALVEENVKSSVQKIASDEIVTELFNKAASGGHQFFIHGWVYDIENGEVKDLGVSVGPPGAAIPPTPFTAAA